MKSMNWISGTGRSPYRAIPIAVPMTLPSLRGVSKTRSGNSSMRPSVHRNTPPSLPTSSPRMMTRSSRRISSRRALFTACTIVIWGMSRLAPHPFRVRVVRLLRPLDDPHEPRVLAQGSELRLGFSLFAILFGLRARLLEVREGLLRVPAAGREARELVPRGRPRRVELRGLPARLLRGLQVPEVREVEREGHPQRGVVRVGLHGPPIERDGLVGMPEEGVALGREDQRVRVVGVPGEDLVDHRDRPAIVAVPEGLVGLLEAAVDRGRPGRGLRGGTLRGHLSAPGPAAGPRAPPRGAAASPRTHPRRGCRSSGAGSPPRAARAPRSRPRSPSPGPPRTPRSRSGGASGTAGTR